MNNIIVLASISPFRKTLLSQLKISFHTFAPKIDETQRSGETAENLAKRLSLEKAQAAVNMYPNALIIGSDQVAVFKDQILGKPLNRTKAVAQLKMLSNHKSVFYTGLCLLNSSSGKYQTDVVPVEVNFRKLSDQQIEYYLQKERPYWCTGAAKIEGLGIALVKSIKTKDYTSLIGLPLIRLIEMLKEEGVSVLS